MKKITSLLFAALLLAYGIAPAVSYPDTQLEVKQEISNDGAVQRIETKPTDIPNFKNPIVLLVGLSSKELTYRELSNLSGFEFFSVPYSTDIKKLSQQINPPQVIVKHPSGFVGLYTAEGQLVRGVETETGNEGIADANGVPPSIIQPIDTDTSHREWYYPGSLTGSIPHGGLGYEPPPKKQSRLRGLIKLAAFGSLVPFQYPGYHRDLTVLDGERQLFPALFAPIAPNVITSTASYFDSKLDQAEYESARTQPRDYMFQPIYENY